MKRPANLAPHAVSFADKDACLQTDLADYRRLKRIEKGRIIARELATWIDQDEVKTWAQVKAVIWDRCMGVCAYCGKQMNPFRDFTIDHVDPRCRGGEHTLDNFVGCCRSCNSSKGGRRPEEWQQR